MTPTHDVVEQGAAADHSRDGVLGRHDVDRAFKELLEEERIAQMGGQILLGFLLAVAYTPAMDRATPGDRMLYGWAIAVTTSAVVLLLSTVALHRVNFGRRLRSSILVVGHVLACIGLTALGLGIVLSVWLAARMAIPDQAPVLVWSAVLLVLAFWLATPLALRWTSTPSPPPSGAQPSPSIHPPDARAGAAAPEGPPAVPGSRSDGRSSDVVRHVL